MFGCYHVSQQNTFIGRLTPALLEAVLRRAAPEHWKAEVFSVIRRLALGNKIDET